MPVVGVLAVAAGLFLPWLDLGTFGTRSGFGAAVVSSTGTVPSPFSYGLLAAVGLMVATSGLLRASTAARSLLAVGGLIVLAPALLFPILSTTADQRLLFRLALAKQITGTVYGQFGYKVPRHRIVNLGLIPLRGDAQIVASALRIGWLLVVLGGVVLVASGRRPLWSAMCRSARTTVACAVLAVGLALSLMPGMSAGSAATRAVAAEHHGDYASAVQRFTRAFDLNPSLRSQPAVELAYGAALVGAGEENSPVALLARGQAARLNADLAGAIALEEQAHRLDPANSVISFYLEQNLLAPARKNIDGSLLAGYRTDPALRDVSMSYTLGRLLAQSGRCDEAIAELDSVAGSTSDQNIRSSALTYVALCRRTLGDVVGARATLLAAIAADKGYYNSTARALAAGLYDPRAK